MNSENSTLEMFKDDPVGDRIYRVDSLVELNGPIYKLSVKGDSYLVREGTWFEKDEKGEYQPDWSLTWIYRDEEDPADYVYYEQGARDTAVYNFLKGLEDKE